MNKYTLAESIKLSEAYANCETIIPDNYKCIVRNVELLENHKGNTLRFTVEYFIDEENTKFVFSDYPLYGHGKSFCINSLMSIFSLYNCYIDISYISYITDDNLKEMSKIFIGKDMFIRVERINYHFNRIRLHI